MKQILLTLILLPLFAQSATFDLSVDTSKSSERFKMKQNFNQATEMTKGNIAIKLTPKKATIQNVSGIVLDISVFENNKEITSPTLFVKPGQESEFSKKNFANAPDNFKLNIKANL